MLRTPTAIPVRSIRTAAFGLVLSLAPALGLAACGGDGAPGTPAGAVVDTLPHGGIRVSSPEGGVWGANPDLRWRLVEEMRIGGIDGEGPEVFGSVGSVIEGPMGRVWVADTQATEVRVFQGDGRFVRTVGRQGEGPGEFSRLGSLHLAPDGTVWVDDARLRRWVVFDSAGVHLAVHPGNSNVNGGVRRWTSDGRLLEVGMVMDPRLEPAEALSQASTVYSVRQLEPGGTLGPPDTVRVAAPPEREVVRFADPRGVTRITRGIPHRRSPLAVPGFEGDLWVTSGGDGYAIHRVALGGDTLLTMERAFTPVPLTEEARASALAEMEPPEGLRRVDGHPLRIPEHFAPFYFYHPATDGSLWVVSVGAGGGQALDVFDADGYYLGHLDLPPELSRLLIKHITGERIYAVAMDELGVASVVMLRIDRGG